MDPGTIYMLIFVGNVGLCAVVALLNGQSEKRTCPNCDARVPLTWRACRTCRYRFP